MPYMLTVFSNDIGGAERILRRVVIREDAVDAYVAAPSAALAAMLPVGGTRPDGFRIVDARGSVRVAHAAARPVRFAG